MTPDTPGARLLRLRLGAGLGQQDLADAASVAAGTISMVERGKAWLDPRAMTAIAQVLDVAPEYFVRPGSEPSSTTPQLRAYADASQRTVDRVVNDSVTAVDAISEAQLSRVADVLPIFDGDLNDPEEIERIALDVRTLADIAADAPIGNATRTAERLGCIVLPMDSELGRHLGMSLRVSDVPVIRVSRTSEDPQEAIPGDRQRFTVAHELGHLVLHAGLGSPLSAADASRREHEAHRFASAFLAPGDAVLDDLARFGDRVTLSTLTRLKERWGFSIKAFVTRFRQLGVIDDEQARSLFKQISARRWNKTEPVVVGNESAVWLHKAIARSSSGPRALTETTGLGQAYFDRWLDWAPRPHRTTDAVITTLSAPESAESPAHSRLAPVTRLPQRA